jgi:DNA helicase INO80
MFRDPVLRRSVDDEGERMHQGEQAYGPQSPAQTHGRPHHSPTTAPLPAHPPNFHPHQHHRPPPSPSTTELPPISTALYSRDTAASKYYDPTSDHGERSLGRDTARYDPQYPPQVRLPTLPAASHAHRPHHHGTFYMQGCEANPRLQQTRDPHVYPDARPAHSPYEKPYHSPIANAYAHQSPLQRPHSQHQHAGGMEAMSHSPVSPSVYQSMNRGAVQPPPTTYARRPSIKDEVCELMPLIPHSMLTTPQAPPPTRADPMSLSSIMSAGNDNDPPAKAQPLPSLHPALSKPSNPFVKQEPMHSPAPADLAPQENGVHHRGPYEPLQPVGIADAPQHFAPPRELPVPDEAEIEAALAHIETKQMGDLDGSAPFEHEEWRQHSLKRGLEVISGETAKRKVCVRLRVCPEPC